MRAAAVRARLFRVLAVVVAASAIGACRDGAPERAEPGLLPTAAGRTDPSTPFAGGPHQGPCVQLPPPNPLVDWIPEDLPLPAGTFTVLETLLDDPAVRAVVLSVPLEYGDFVRYADAEWRSHGWVTNAFDAEPGETEVAFVRGEELGSFRARQLYCDEGWSEIALYLGGQ